MKRITLSVVALLLAMVMAAPAMAQEVNMQGQFEMTARWNDNLNFNDGDNDGTSEDDFTVDQRIRVYFEYVASENLRGVFGIQADNDWGVPDAGALGDDPNTLSVKHGYIDFLWPNTALRIRAGRFGFAPPANFGSPIWDDDVSGVTAAYAFNDQVSLVLGYLRLVDALYASDNTGTAPFNTNANYEDEIDAVAAVLPVTGDGWNLTPFAIYHWVGSAAYNLAIDRQNRAIGPYAEGLDDGFNGVDEDDSSNGYWIGAPFSLTMFDPWTFYAELFYGAFDADQSENDRSGWWFDAAIDYAWADLFTLRVLGFYGSGDDDDTDDGSERFPTLGADDDGCCGLTSFGFDGSAAAWAGNQDNLLVGNGYAFWGIGISLMDFSFVDKLSHTLTFVYGQGTNDEDALSAANINDAVIDAPGLLNGSTYLTEEDSFFEINFDHTYQLYENLTAYLELGYLNIDVDDDVWGDDDTDAATKASFTLRYNF